MVWSHLLHGIDSGYTAALVLLNLSSAFDIVDHAIFLKCLRTAFRYSAGFSRIFPADLSKFVEVRGYHPSSSSVAFRGVQGWARFCLFYTLLTWLVS